MNRWTTAVIVAATVLVPAAAHAGAPIESCTAGVNPFAKAAVATISVCVNSQAFAFTTFAGTGKPYTMAPQTRYMAAGGSFTVSAVYNNDPFVSFTFTSIIPSFFGIANFDIYFNTPVVGGGYTNASSAGKLSVTADGTNTTALVSNGIYPSYISGYADGANLNVNTGSGACSATTTGQVTTATTACNPPGANSTFAPISPSVLTSRLSYAQSASGNGSTSTAAWTGIVSLTSTTTVPEPSTVTLLVAGFLAIGAVRFRRNRS